MGHIDFTVGQNSEVSNFIFDALDQVNQREHKPSSAEVEQVS